MDALKGSFILYGCQASPFASIYILPEGVPAPCNNSLNMLVVDEPDAVTPEIVTDAFVSLS